MKKQKSTTKEKTFGFGEVMSMLEGMNDGIQLISEQHSGIIGRLDGMDARFDKMDARFDKMDARFDNLETKVDSLETKVDSLQVDVTDIKHKLSQKVDLEDFQKLEKRLIKLENFVLNFSQKH
jgi:archaellum component FlaC